MQFSFNENLFVYRRRKIFSFISMESGVGVSERVSRQIRDKFRSVPATTSDANRPSIPEPPHSRINQIPDPSVGIVRILCYTGRSPSVST